MKKLNTYTFQVLEKKVFDYSKGEMIVIDYSPKITEEIKRDIRNSFEYLFDIQIETFIFKTKTIGKQLRITTSLNFLEVDVKLFPHKIYSAVRPKKKKDYANFTFKLKLL